MPLPSFYPMLMAEDVEASVASAMGSLSQFPSGSLLRPCPSTFGWSARSHRIDAAVLLVAHRFGLRIAPRDIGRSEARSITYA